MKVALDLGLWLEGGTVMVQLGDQEDAVGGIRLTELVHQLIEAHEVDGIGSITERDVSYLRQVEEELRTAANLLSGRLRLEDGVASVRGAPV